MWFYMACRVAVRVVRGQGAEDVRSDDEDEIDADEDGLKVEMIAEDGDGMRSGESTPGSMSSEGSETLVGVESLDQGEKKGVHVPQVLKGLQCKRELREEEGARRRK